MIVERARHIAEVETNKIKENPAAQEDFEMFDQNQFDETSEKDIGEDTDKGKKPVIVTTC
jgi:hypothetical protein